MLDNDKLVSSLNFQSLAATSSNFGQVSWEAALSRMARVSICSAKFVENLDGMRFRTNDKYNNSGKNVSCNMDHLLIFENIVIVIII